MSWTSSNFIPTFLTSSIPFRRRSSTSTTLTTSSSLPSSPISPGTSPQTFPTGASPTSPVPYLKGTESYLRCNRCLTDLCNVSQIISKGFTGRHGRAYLVAPPSEFPTPHAATPRDRAVRKSTNLPNTKLDRPTPRQLVTGAHTVCDVLCLGCDTILGWKYVAAEEEGQRYKVGKFILETDKVTKVTSWENDVDNDPFEDRMMRLDDVEFDSQDEEECEDLFAGIWSPRLARKRRQNKAVLSRD